MNTEWLKTAVLSLACVVSFGLCGQPVAKAADHAHPGGRSRIFEMETKLGNDWRFHASHSDYEGYLISIEKVARAYGALDKKTAPSYQYAAWQNKPVFNFQALSNSFEPKQACGEVADIMKLLDDEKVQLITQVTYRSSQPDRGHLVNVLWDVYSDADAPVDKLSKEKKREIVRQRNEHLIDRSAAVLLDTLASDLKKRLANAPSTARYTHIIVMSTGWNTPLWESDVNYADWQKVIGREMRLLHPTTPFRPLFIGLTWPSFWKSRWKWTGPRSFLNKAHDADEIGLTWANLLVNKVLPDVVAGLDQKPRLIAIGHSFGARLLSRAVNSGMAISQFVSGKEGRFSLFIGLQAAFSVNRFTGQGGEGSPYSKTFTNRVARYAFVSSEHDKAMQMGPGTLSRRLRGKSSGTYPGHWTVAKYVERRPIAWAFTEAIKVHPDGIYTAPEKDAPIWLLDGSEAVRHNVYSTGGGAHSDVFNKGVGALIANLIKQADDANLK
jgi:hypothetical protein